MNSKTILAALVAVTIGGVSAIPAFAKNDQQALNQMAMQMYMQQQATQQQNLLNAQVTQANQAALAEAGWVAQNGAYPHRDRFGRPYGPSGYAPNSGAGNFSNNGLPFFNSVLPIGYGNNNNNCAYPTAYNNTYPTAYNNYSNVYPRGYGFSNFNNNGVQNKLNRIANKINRSIRYW